MLVARTILCELEEDGCNGAAQRMRVCHFSQGSQRLRCSTPHHRGVILGQALKHPANGFSLSLGCKGIGCGQ